MRWVGRSGPLLVALFFWMTGLAHGETLRIGIEGAYPPFSSVDAKGHIVGFDADMAQALCKQMQARCKFVKQDWERAIPDLNAHKIDALVSSMAITPERLKLVTFTRPYYNSPVRLVVRRNSGLNVVGPAALAGKTIAVEAQTIYETYARAVFEPAGARVLVISGGLEGVWQALIAGKADAVPNDVVANAEFLKTPAGKAFVESGPPITDTKYLGTGAAIALAKGDTALAKRFDEALLAIHRSGEYAQIRARYFDFDIWAQ